MARRTEGAGRPAESAVVRGRRFESLAARYLRRQGLEILARNVRFGRGELDLVAREAGGVVVFVEVKGRSGRGRGHPLSSLTRRKRREVEAVARWWIRSNPPAPGYRFDAVAVEPSPDRPADWVVTHVRDAWRPNVPY